MTLQRMCITFFFFTGESAMALAGSRFPFLVRALPGGEQHGPGLGLSGCLESKQLSLSTQRVDEGSGTCIGYLDYLFKNRHVETEKDLLFPACKPRRVGVQSDVVNSILMLEHQ